MDKKSRIKVYLSFFMRATIVAALVIGAFLGQWLIVFISSLSLVGMFLPAIIERNFRIVLPAEIELAVLLFVYVALFLGNVRDYYEKFWWWDHIMHTAAGVVLGFFGFMILYELYVHNNIKMSPLLLSFLAFTFALAMGALWEVFEFTADKMTGSNLQKSNDDTMWDLIADSVGAVSVSIAGYFYVKKGKRGEGFFGELLERHLKGNGHFKK